MRRIIYSLFLMLSAFSVISQQNIREQVYLHVNSSSLITGETLHFSAYSISEKSGKPSLLSKILYVELVGSTGAVYQEKISLENGKGHSDFFISSLWATGQYQLLAYTRWMKNFDDFSQTAITIINPYEDYHYEKKDQKLQIDFFPASDQLISGVDNMVGFKICGLNGETYSGKIVSQDGETLGKFTHDSFGYGKFQITPAFGKKYQVILENSDGLFEFFELPKIESSGTVINILDLPNHLDIRLETYPKKGNYFLLKIKSKSGSSEMRIKSTSSTLITKKEIGADMVTLSVVDENDALLSRRAYQSTLQGIRKENLDKTFLTREAVTLTPNLESGNYSVSVRKKDVSIESRNAHASFAGFKTQLTDSDIKVDSYLSQKQVLDMEAFLLTSGLRTEKEIPDSVFYIPEVREEIITGTMRNANNQASSDEKVAITFPGDHWQLRIALTDKAGHFSIPFQSTAFDATAYVLSLNLESGNSIIVESPFLKSYPDFDYSIPALDSTQIKELVEKSIRNQIENAYYEAPKSEPLSHPWLPQVQYNYVYILDEYNRFPTLKETFTEYIVSTSVRDRRDPVIKPYQSNDPKEFRNQPLILLDGIPVDPEKILEFSPYKIESISILNNRYFAGPHMADGLVDFKTKKDMLGEFKLDDQYQKVEIKGVVKPKTYTYPDYGNDPLSRIPDQRDQLYWHPHFRVNQEKQSQIQFYTSDVDGLYEAVIEGFTDEGKPVSIIQSFQVKKRDKS